jgi:hypothetical protein
VLVTDMPRQWVSCLRNVCRFNQRCCPHIGSIGNIDDCLPNDRWSRNMHTMLLDLQCLIHTIDVIVKM